MNTFPLPRLIGALWLLGVGASALVFAAGSAPEGGRLSADWPQRLTEAGCPPRPGHPGERVCQNPESFEVCKEAVQANHLKRCRLAGTKEVYPPAR